MSRMEKDIGLKILFVIFFLSFIVLTVVAFTYKNSVPVEEEYSEAELLYWQRGIIYEVYPLSFFDTNSDGVGDLQGITSKWSYFVDLGVEILWLSPIFTSPMKDFGYDISNFMEIDPIFGTMQDFEELVRVMHSKGLKVILDFVPNHSSNEHDWFKKSELKKDPYTDYYMWKNSSGIDEVTGEQIPPNNWVSVFKNSAWEWSDTRQQFYLHQFLKEQPDLNLRNQRVVDELQDILAFWLDKGIDGFRMDAIKHLFEVEDVYGADEPVAVDSGTEDPTDYAYLNHTLTTNLPENYEMIRSWRKLLDSYWDKLLMVEIYDGSIDTIMGYYGTEEDPLADFPFNFGIINTLTSRENLTGAKLKECVDDWIDNMPTGKWPNWVLGNHDKGRVASRLGEDLVDALHMFSLLLPGTPVTYQGEEIGMVDSEISYEATQDPAGCAYGPERYDEFSRDPERTPLQWDSTQCAGFTNGSSSWLPVNPNYVTLNIEAQKNASQSHLKVYKELATLRKENIFRNGQLAFPVVSEHTLTFLRYIEGEGGYLIVINTSTDDKTIDLSRDKNFELPQSADIVLRSSSDAREDTKPGTSLELSSIPMLGGEGIVFYIPMAVASVEEEEEETADKSNKKRRYQK